MHSRRLDATNNVGRIRGNLFNLSDEPISTKTPVEGATAEFLERVMGILTVALLCDIQSGTDGINDITTRPRRRHGAGDRRITGE